MNRVHTAARAAIVLLVAAMVAAACAPATTTGTGGTTATGNSYQLGADKITVINHNDSGLYGSTDEPYVYNIWFRVAIGQANSADAGVSGSRADALSDVGDGQSVVVTGGQRAAHDFNNVKLLDVPDLLNSSNHLELVGSWTCAMEKDDVGVAGLADSVASVLKNTLNTIVASGSIPSDTNQLVSSILGNFGTVFNLVAGVLFDSIPGLPDDAIGSNFYIGVGAKGALSDIINATLPSVPFPTVQIPIFTVPPDIGGGHLFSLGNTTNTFPGDIYDQGEGRYAIDMSMNAEPAPNQTPVASFAPSATSGTPPMAVTFNGAGSYDPDGTIVSYNWDFGDFTTGSGAGVGHTFTSAGTFPVTLTVTDNRGGQATKIVNISVGGAPTVAPTGLQKTGSGCCNTYGDFAWNEVPGATAYEINMDGYFGGGCVTDADSVITGQTGVGRVQAFGLCLGSSYNVKIRAQANGQWGPWSPTVNISL